ncbi:hypothetical protein M0Q50_03305 [bacterium]|jgi:hypothetical protein|nr:hypothetical protein [bacterium]
MNDDEWKSFMIEYNKKLKEIGADKIVSYETFLIWQNKLLRIKKLNSL